MIRIKGGKFAKCPNFAKNCEFGAFLHNTTFKLKYLDSLDFNFSNQHNAMFQN